MRCQVGRTNAPDLTPEDTDRERRAVASSRVHGVGNREPSHVDSVASNCLNVRANMTKCPESGMKTVLLSGDPLKSPSCSSSPCRVHTSVSLLPNTTNTGTVICDR